jgi:hypothetical protein
VATDGSPSRRLAGRQLETSSCEPEALKREHLRSCRVSIIDWKGVVGDGEIDFVISEPSGSFSKVADRRVCPATFLKLTDHDALVAARSGVRRFERRSDPSEEDYRDECRTEVSVKPEIGTALLRTPASIELDEVLSRLWRQFLRLDFAGQLNGHLDLLEVRGTVGAPFQMSLESPSIPTGERPF